MTQAIRRQLAWDRLDENWRELARKNPTFRRKKLGRKVVLDPAQQRVYALYLRRRRESPSEGGIVIPDDTAPILARHLYAMDQVFAEHRASLSKQGSAQPPQKR